MKSWTTKKNNYRIHRVLDTRSNVFLVSGGAGHLLVDTGMEFAFTRLIRNIRSLGVMKGEITYLILTHSHYDHCRNAAALKEKEHCRIIMSEQESAFTPKGYTPIPGGTFRITDFLAGIGKKIGKYRFGYKAFTADITVGEKYSMKDKGFEVELLHNAGHSAGSVSIVVDHEIALAGDAVYRLFKNTVMPPFADNREEMIMNWKKLLDTGCRIFLPGHGDEISREFLEKEFHRYTSEIPA